MINDTPADMRYVLELRYTLSYISNTDQTATMLLDNGMRQ